MFCPSHIVSAAHFVQAMALLSFTLLLLSVKNARAWKKIGFGGFWTVIFCVSVAYSYGNYKDAKEMISKASMTSNSIHLLREYLDSGIDVDLRDEKGMTPLMHAIYCNSVPNIRYLLSRGANSDIKNVYGTSARDIAYECKNRDVIDLFQ